MKKGQFSKLVIFAMSSVLLLLSLLFFISKDKKMYERLSEIPATVLGGFSDAISIPVDAYQEVINQTSAFINTYSENKVLKEELLALKNQERLIQQLKQDNEALRQEVKVASQFSSEQLISARVIYRSTQSWLNALTINKGRQDNLSEQMLVMTDKGVIGTINQLNNQTAQIELLTNTVRQKSVAVKLASGGEVIYGLVIGYDVERSALVVGQFNKQVSVKVGASVVTSGLDGTGLEDLPIGTVKEVGRSEDQSLRLYIKPSADFSDLSSVLVIGVSEYD